MSAVACPTCGKPVVLSDGASKIAKCRACGEAFDAPQARQKICCACGVDVSQQKRRKDAAGNYYCRRCWESATRPTPPTREVASYPCAGCGGSFAIEEVYDQDGQTICHACYAHQHAHVAEADPLADLAGLTDVLATADELLQCPSCNGRFSIANMDQSGICRDCARRTRQNNRTAKKGRKNATPLVVAAAAVLLLLVGGIVWWAMGNQGRQPGMKETAVSSSPSAPTSAAFSLGDVEAVRGSILDYARFSYDYEQAKSKYGSAERDQAEASRLVNLRDEASITAETLAISETNLALARMRSATSGQNLAVATLAKYGIEKVKICRDQLLNDPKTPDEYRRHIFEVCSHVTSSPPRHTAEVASSDSSVPPTPPPATAHQEPIHSPDAARLAEQQRAAMAAQQRLDAASEILRAYGQASANSEAAYAVLFKAMSAKNPTEQTIAIMHDEDRRYNAFEAEKNAARQKLNALDNEVLAEAARAVLRDPLTSPESGAAIRHYVNEPHRPVATPEGNSGDGVAGVPPKRMLARTEAIPSGAPTAPSASSSPAAELLDLGYRQLEGDGIPQDYAGAIQNLSKAAKLGSADAAFLMGSIYMEGKGVPKSGDVTMRWFQEAANLGSKDGAFAVAGLYADGELVKKDDSAATKWFRRAAELGDVKAALEFATRAQRAIGMAADPAIALKWYGVAAKNGDAEAMNSIGAMYAQGEGVAKDLNQARRWFQQAVDAGNERARRNLKLTYTPDAGGER